MKKLVVGLALAALTMSPSMVVAAQPAAMLDRSASNVGDSEELAGGGFFAVILAVAAGVGLIFLIDSEEEDNPASP